MNSSNNNTDDKALFNNETRIKGTALRFDQFTSKNGKQWAKLTLEHMRKYNNEETQENYEIAVFGKAMEGQASHIREGDQIEVICRVSSEEWKGRWYLKLSLKDVKFLQIGNRNNGQGAAASPVTTEEPDNGGDGDADLPF